MFDVSGVALLVADGDQLVVAASAGQALTARSFTGSTPGRACRSASAPARAAAGRDARRGPDRLRATRSAFWPSAGCPPSEATASCSRTFANHAALALERAQLREQALRSELLEEVDGLRHALMGAVSHDLRTPLATMKVASSTLLRPGRIRSTEADAARAPRLIDDRDRPADPTGRPACST